MMPISSVRSMRPTYRASRKASTTSSYNRKLRKQNMRLEPSQIHYIHYIDCFCCPDEHPFPRLLCAFSLSFPISMLIYVHLPISFSPSTIMCTYFKGLVQYEALPLWRIAFHLWSCLRRMDMIRYPGLNIVVSLSSWQIWIFSRIQHLSPLFLQTWFV